MNWGHGRLLFCGCLTLLIGCGARTSTLEDELGGQSAGGDSGNAGSHAGSGGASASGGTSPGAGGVSTAGAAGWHSIPAAGAPAAGFGAGGAQTAGAPAGGFGTGGGQIAGAPSGGFAGSAGFEGFGGDAGTGGITELCSALGGSSCAECQCQTCAPAIENCFADLGCALIFACAQQSGCTGLSCYSPTTCQPVIDQFGGPLGTSVKKVFSLLTCAVSAQANCGCN